MGKHGQIMGKHGQIMVKHGKTWKKHMLKHGKTHGRTWKQKTRNTMQKTWKQPWNGDEKIRGDRCTHFFGVSMESWDFMRDLNLITWVKPWVKPWVLMGFYHHLMGLN